MCSELFILSSSLFYDQRQQLYRCLWFRPPLTPPRTSPFVSLETCIKSGVYVSQVLLGTSVDILIERPQNKQTPPILFSLTLHPVPHAKLLLQTISYL